MPLVSIYCIDTSSLIEAKRAYPPTVLPDLWTNLESLIKQGRLRAPSSVRDEVTLVTSPPREYSSTVNDAGRRVTIEHWAGLRRTSTLTLPPCV